MDGFAKDNDEIKHVRKKRKKGKKCSGEHQHRRIVVLSWKINLSLKAQLWVVVTALIVMMASGDGWIRRGKYLQEHRDRKVRCVQDEE